MQQDVKKQMGGTGRRKASVARVTLKPGKGLFEINRRDGLQYMGGHPHLIRIMEAPLVDLKLRDDFDICITVQGGGLAGQADAIKLGISRALCLVNPEYRRFLKQKKYLTRDARVKERKKYGLKKARKAPQFSKR